MTGKFHKWDGHWTAGDAGWFNTFRGRLGRMSSGEAREMSRIDKDFKSRVVRFGEMSESLRVKAARSDINAFIEYVFEDDATGKPVKQAPLHIEMQKFISDNPKCVVVGHVNCGKSVQVSLAVPLFELGRDNSKRIFLVERSYAQAVKRVRSCAAHIESNERLHRVFPGLVPGDVWGADKIRVQRDRVSNDYSIQGLGISGSILGARADIIIFDDVIDRESTLTEAGRRETFERIKSTFLGRLAESDDDSGDECRVICVANPWHPDDAMAKLHKEDGWPYRTFPVTRPGTGEHWFRTPAWEKKMRKLLRDIESARQLDCQYPSSAMSRFSKPAFERSYVRGMFGRALYSPAIRAMQPGCQTWTGVDPAFKMALGADFSAVTTIMTLPDGRLRHLRTEIGRWEAFDLAEVIAAHHESYLSEIIVESNAAQVMLAQLLERRLPGVSVKRFYTSARNKSHHAFGIDALAASIRAGMWEFAEGSDGEKDPDLTCFVSDAINYSPDMKHTPDSVMSVWLAWNGATNRNFDYEVGGGESSSAVFSPKTIARSDDPYANGVGDGLVNDSFWIGLEGDLLEMGIDIDDEFTFDYIEAEFDVD